MDFSLSPEIAGFRDAIRRFVDAELIPLEADPASYDAHENIAPELLARMQARAKAAGLTVALDPSWDETLIGKPGLLKACAGVDIFLPNAEEAIAITGKADLDAALDVLVEHFSVVAIKRGGRGALLGAGETRISAKAPKVHVVDTTGAGDAFNAGLINAYLARRPLGECLDAGVAAGSLSVQSIGGAPRLFTSVAV